MTDFSVLAARYARRPLLMLPSAAEELVGRIRAVDERAFERPGRLGALLRSLGGGRPRPAAMDDEEYTPTPLGERMAYAPLYVGEPEDVGYCWSLSQGVALMQADTVLLDRGGEDFCGTIYHGYDTMLAGMQDALADQRVQALFLRLCTPGGVVAGGITALAGFMRSARKAAGGKPIWVYADMACSAGYWIAAQADRIIAPGVGLVGSVGAVLIHENYAGALEKAGVEITPIQFGSQKTAGAWWDALSGPARDDLQAEIDQCGRDFVADVVAGRPALTAQALIDTQARVFMGQHDDSERSALALGLVDDIGSEADAFAELVATVNPGISAPVSALSSSPAAIGSRAGGKTAQEASMSRIALQNSAAMAALLVEETQVNAKAAEIAARKAALAASEAAKPAPDTEDAAGGGEDDAGEADGGETPDDAPDDGDPDSKKMPESEKIAGSAEAKANPALALAAISSGQRLEQFQASFAAAGVVHAGGQLDRALAGKPRLAPDAPPTASNAAKLDPTAIYDRRRGGARRATR